MPSATIRRVQSYAYTHPFVGDESDALTPGHTVNFGRGVQVLLSLNR